MPDYHYVCTNREGQFFQGACTAGDEQELVRLLGRRGLYTLWVEVRVREDPEERAITRLVLSPIEISEVVALLIRRSQGHRLPHPTEERVVMPHVEGGPPETPPVEAPPSPSPAPSSLSSSTPDQAPDPERVRTRRQRLVAAVVFPLALIAISISPLQRWREIARQKARYAQAASDMQGIAAAVRRFQTVTKQYPGPGMAGKSPDELSSAFASWPVPPCPGWTYSWDAWQLPSSSLPTRRVTLRNADLYSVLYFCLEEAGCNPPTMWGHGSPLGQFDRLSCS
jgi:hypothetical protein